MSLQGGLRRTCAVPTSLATCWWARCALPTLICSYAAQIEEPFPARPVICPHLRNSGLGMSDAYIIEVASQAAGIVVRTAEGYRFFAAARRFNSLEGQLFRNPRQAERAAFRLISGDVTLAA